MILLDYELSRPSSAAPKFGNKYYSIVSFTLIAIQDLAQVKDHHQEKDFLEENKHQDVQLRSLISVIY